MVSILTYCAAVITDITFVYILLYHHHRHPLSLLHGSLAHSQNSTGLADQALIIQCSAKIFLLIRNVLRITASCIRIYRTGRRLGSSELSCNVYGIIPAVDSTGGVINKPFSVVTFLNAFQVCICYIIIIIIIIIIIDMNVSCHRSFLPGTSLEPAVIPTAHASSFTLQYFPYYV